jgi:hypothetical protein
MKLPFELGVKFVFRLIAPGFVLSLGMYPLLAGLRDATGVSAKIEYIFIVNMLITGWLVVLLDQPLYMLFEGRRFWPGRLWKWFYKIEQRRLAKLLKIAAETSELSKNSKELYEKRIFTKRNLEAWVQIREFPLNEEGKYQAAFPTRLGNLLTAYETYPKIRYGMDGVFYWYRIWDRLDRESREELDTRQAVADSGLYLSFALYANAVIWTFYSLPYIHQTAVNQHLPTIIRPWALIPLCLIAAYMAYRLSLYSQAQYGEAFKSLFDNNEKKIDVSAVVARVAEILRDSSILNLERQEQFLIAWRYLHNYRVKCTGSECAERRPMSPEEFKDHYASSHQAKKLKEEKDGSRHRDVTPYHEQKIQSHI